MEALPDTIVIIDNSNLWIEGKKAYAEKQKLSASEDPRWRLSIGKLHQELLQGRNGTYSSFLYGSVPPPSEDLWEQFRQHCTVQTRKRSSLTKKEKGVDAAAIVNATAMATAAKIFQKSITIVLVTGDADFMPVIEMFYSVKNVTWEIWSWGKSLSNDMRNLEKCKIVYLDDCIDRIGFVADTWKLAARYIPAERSFVVAMPKGHDDLVNTREKLTNFLEEKLMIPSNLYVLDDSLDVAVILSIALEPSDFDSVMEDAKKEIGDEVVVSFAQWKQENQQEKSTEEKYFSYFDCLSDESNPDGIKDDSLSTDVNNVNEGEWSCSKTKNKLKQKKASSDICPFSSYCRYYNNGCVKKHLQHAVHYLSLHKNIPKVVIKQRECTLPACNKDYCKFLHPGEKKLCLTCDKYPDKAHEWGKCPLLQNAKMSMER